MKHCRELPKKDDNKTGMLGGPAMSGSGKDTEVPGRVFRSGGPAQREHLHG